MPDSARLRPLIAAMLRPLPLFPLQGVVDRLARETLWRHARVIERLGAEAERTFAVDPVDLPFSFLLRPAPDGFRISVVRTLAGEDFDASIAGPFLTLVELGRGRLDGDALFFSQDIQVEGNVAAVVALRNALDAEGVDVVAEFARLFGPAEGIVFGAAERFDGFVRRFLTERETAPPTGTQRA
ncbi:MAG: SCP2 sterol-binding domain-containing protein [Hyphomicrobiales bacterium]|nr:SCP2 sterol-binding domain-containing protein [Hyphomicrobiales bacterium]